jgi:hypothetical protein
MKLLKFLTLLVLLQVGDKLWVNPNLVVGLKDNTQVWGNGTTFVPTDCATIIFFPGRDSYECSDWHFDKVKKALEAK